MSYKLREPQQRILYKIKASARLGGKKILVMAPTGFGKTILAYELCRGAIAKGSKVLFTSHRINLAEQSRDKFESLNPSYLQGENKEFNENYNLLVATLQTLVNTEIQEPKLIIIDEVHFAFESHLIQSLFERFPNATFIGLSATPTDNRNYLLDGFDAIIDDYQTKDLIDLGWLVPFKCFATVKLDTSTVKVSKSTNDYQEKDLIEEKIKQNYDASIVENYQQLGEQRKFICFAINQKHCIDLQQEFYKQGILTEIIIASTPKKNRLEYLNDFKNGKIKGLISVEILTAGFDNPTVSCIILACPTKDWKKYIQCAGRGIRLLGQSIEESISNGKSDCILLDCGGCIEEHGMPDERKLLTFGKKISRVLDRELNLETSNENRANINENISEEKQLFLKKIGSLLDLYDGKIYTKESELQEDVNNFLKKTPYFWYRQNSGKAFMDGRWVHFASKAGLPDNAVFYKNSSFYFGLELKLPSGRLSEKQKETLPEMMQKNVLFFICESVYDVYKSIEHVEKNIDFTDNGFFIKNEIYELSDRQIEMRKKLKL